VYSTVDSGITITYMMSVSSCQTQIANGDMLINCVVDRSTCF